MNLNLISNLKVLLGSCLILQHEIFGGFSGISFRLRGDSLRKTMHKNFFSKYDQLGDFVTFT